MKTINAKDAFMKIKNKFADSSFHAQEVREYLQKEFVDIEGAKFENCHGSLLTFSQLLAIFVRKGKLMEEAGIYQVNPNFECVCQHHT